MICTIGVRFGLVLPPNSAGLTLLLWRRMHTDITNANASVRSVGRSFVACVSVFQHTASEASATTAVAPPAAVEEAVAAAAAAASGDDDDDVGEKIRQKIVEKKTCPPEKEPNPNENENISHHKY